MVLFVVVVLLWCCIISFLESLSYKKYIMKISRISLVAGWVTGALGASDSWSSEQWDAIIVGAGPAGIVGMNSGYV